MIYFGSVARAGQSHAVVEQQSGCGQGLDGPSSRCVARKRSKVGYEIGLDAQGQRVIGWVDLTRELCSCEVEVCGVQACMRWTF